MPEDIAITSSKSDINPCSHGQETDRQKSADGWTDGQTDGFSALYSRYILRLHVHNQNFSFITINAPAWMLTNFSFGVSSQSKAWQYNRSISGYKYITASNT